jgi:hypothetical protein
MVSTIEQIITKKEFDEFLKLKGEIRGLGFKTEAKFVLKEEGEEGLKRLEDQMAKFGYPYSEIKTMDFYPLGLLAVALVVIKRLFNYDDKKFQEMGKFEAKSSLIIRLFMKYFVSLEKVAKEAPKMWRKYYTVGDLRVLKVDQEKRHIIIRIENFSLHPILCQILIGYFHSIVRMVLKGEITCEETKCVFRGDEYHEFSMKW